METIFFRRPREANSVVSGGFVIQAYIHAPVTYKNAEDEIKGEIARVVTIFLPLYVYGDFSDAQVQLTPQSGDGSGPKFKHIQAFKVVLVTCTCKNEEYQIKNKGTSYRAVTTENIVFRRSWASTSVAFMHVPIVCKNEEDPFKIDSARVVTSFSPLLLVYGVFPDSLGQLTLQSENEIIQAFGSPCYLQELFPSL